MLCGLERRGQEFCVNHGFVQSTDGGAVSSWPLWYDVDGLLSFISLQFGEIIHDSHFLVRTMNESTAKRCGPYPRALGRMSSVRLNCIVFRISRIHTAEAKTHLPATQKFAYLLGVTHSGYRLDQLVCCYGRGICAWRPWPFNLKLVSFTGWCEW